MDRHSHAAAIQTMLDMKGSCDDQSFYPTPTLQLQVLHVKKILNGILNNHEVVLVSDGNYFSSGMWCTQRNAKVQPGEIAQFSLIKVTQFLEF